MAAGPDRNNGDDDSRQQGWQDTIRGFNFRRYPHFYRNNFRMFHLRQPEPDTGTNGLVGNYYDSWDNFDEPQGTMVDGSINFSWSGTPPVSGMPSGSSACDGRASSSQMPRRRVQFLGVLVMTGMPVG